MKDRFHFWQQWLFYTSIAFALFGVMLAVYGNNPFFSHYFSAIAEIFWNNPSFPANADSFRAFVSGPFGGTIACCYILLAYIAYYPFKRREKWAWWAIVVAFSIWFVLDSGVCIYYHVYFQVYLINAFSVVVKALPLVFTRRYFFYLRHP